MLMMTTGQKRTVACQKIRLVARTNNDAPLSALRGSSGRRLASPFSVFGDGDKFALPKISIADGATIFLGTVPRLAGLARPSVKRTHASPESLHLSQSGVELRKPSHASGGLGMRAALYSPLASGICVAPTNSKPCTAGNPTPA